MENILKKLKHTQPDAEFAERSRTLILNTPQGGNFHPRIFQRFLDTVQFSAAFGLAALFIFLILGGLSLLNQQLLSPVFLSSLDPDNLAQEVNTFDLQLSQVEYYEDSAEKVEVALQAASAELETFEQDTDELQQLLEELTL